MVSTAKWLPLGLLVTLITGCSGPQRAPRQPFLNATLFHSDQSADRLKPGVAMALGQQLHVLGSWHATCKDNWLARNLDSNPSEFPCDGKKFTLRVQCQTPCQVYPNLRPSQKPNGVNDDQTLVVVPLQTGPFAFVATLESGESAPAATYNSTSIMVQAPERVTLECLYPWTANDPSSSKHLETCDGRSISAQTPFIRPRAMFNGNEYSPKVVTINGRAGFPEKKSHVQFTSSGQYGVVSLADVVSAGPVPTPTPNQEEVNSIAPGRYTVVVSVGETSATYDINVE